MIYPFCLICGILPSVAWLLFFLREDAHPESNRMILKVFCYGIIAAFLAAVFEFIFLGLLEFGSKFFFNLIIIQLVSIFIVVGFTEEFMKYLIVRKTAISDPEFDEPLDAMLYMVIAGLGFAAVENVLYLLSLGHPLNVSGTLILTFFRFLGATFLHALCSGTIGFFLALSFFETKNRLKLIIIGLFLAALLHGLYNFSIMKLDEGFSLILAMTPGIILITTGVFVIFAFRKLKTIASICKLK